MVEVRIRPHLGKAGKLVLHWDALTHGDPHPVAALFGRNARHVSVMSHAYLHSHATSAKALRFPTGAVKK